MAEPEPVPPWWTDPTKNVESLVEAAMRRQDDLRELESAHVRELMERDRDHAREMRQAETARLDAVRLVDVNAVQRAAEVQVAQQQALAAQVATTADVFRGSLAAALEPIQKDIRDLREARDKVAGGKEQVVESRDTRGETRLNLGLLVSIAVLLVAVISLILLYVAK
jgi:hypothetical protein